jgi:hypothetical protein
LIDTFTECPECGNDAELRERGPNRKLRCRNCGFSKSVCIGWKGTPYVSEMAGWKELQDDEVYTQEDLEEVKKKIELMEEEIREKLNNGTNVTPGDKAHFI